MSSTATNAGSAGNTGNAGSGSSDEARHLAAARAWLAADPDATTRAELQALIAAGATVELAERFGAQLEFGTAGLRGVLGAGPNRMNRAVVRRTTAGLCAYLLAQAPDVRARGIVVGRDGRNMSPEFLDDTAGVIAGYGLPVHFFDGVVPTPLVAHAVVALGAAAGVMVTASHNPPEYNGYKVYWGNGAQIIPPHDHGIAAAIDAVGEAAKIRVLSRAEAGALWRVAPASVEEGYLVALEGLQLHREVARDIAIAYTPLHGVGNRLARAALARAGFRTVETVPEQAEPDGAFPTVRFPNPEEPGAMDRVIALGRRMNADLVLANDPDADRLAVAARSSDGTYRVYSGNEVGILLGHYVLTEGKGGSERVAIASLVSTSQLKVIAEALGVRYEETLTGFKWIANRAMELEKSEGARFVFGFEEALGYTVGTVARDKDGIGAAVVMAELCAVCRARGRDLDGELAEIQRRYGLYVGKQKSVTMPGSDGAARIRAVMEDFRATPPTSIGGRAVRAASDLRRGTRVDHAGAITPLSFPPGDVIVYELDGEARIVLRPSGTEPKIKFYFELRETVQAGEPIAAARARGTVELQRLEQSLLERAGVK